MIQYVTVQIQLEADDLEHISLEKIEKAIRYSTVPEALATALDASVCIQSVEAT